ncbi:MAG: hypothetical protein P4L99_01370 [Chthoniobacter sp.]|nr:hypothetical protein [Chthoniobacter sp.]
MTKSTLPTSSFAIITEAKSEKPKPSQPHWQFFLMFLLAVLSPFVAHYLDGKNQTYLFQLNQRQTMDMDKLEQSRREYSLRIQTVTELEAAVAEWKKEREKVLSDKYLLLARLAIAGVNAEIEPPEDNDPQATALAENNRLLQIDNAEFIYSAQRVNACISKASIVFRHTWILTDTRFLTPPQNADSGGHMQQYMKRISDAYRPMITSYIHKAGDAKHSGPLPNFTFAFTKVSFAQIQSDFDNEFNAYYAESDTAITAIYSECLQMLNPESEAPTFPSVAATPIPIPSPVPSTPKKAKSKKP